MSPMSHLNGVSLAESGVVEIQASGAAPPGLGPKDSTSGYGDGLLHCGISAAFAAEFMSVMGHKRRTR
jgi:hypothetical protein